MNKKIAMALDNTMVGNNLFGLAFPNVSLKTNKDGDILPYIIREYALPTNVVDAETFQKNVQTKVYENHLQNLNLKALKLSKTLDKMEERYEDMKEDSEDKLVLAKRINKLTDKYNSLLDVRELYEKAFLSANFKMAKEEDIIPFEDIIASLFSDVDYKGKFFHAIYSNAINGYEGGYKKADREDMDSILNKFLATNGEAYKNTHVKLSAKLYKDICDNAHDSYIWDNVKIRSKFDAACAKNDGKVKYLQKLQNTIVKQTFLVYFSQILKFKVLENVEGHIPQRTSLRLDIDLTEKKEEEEKA